jgi:hypothetical protein
MTPSFQRDGKMQAKGRVSYLQRHLEDPLPGFLTRVGTANRITGSSDRADSGDRPKNVRFPRAVGFREYGKR